MNLSYHSLGLRDKLIQKNLRRRDEVVGENAPMTSVAKRACITRKTPGRIRASPGSPADVPHARGRVIGEMMGYK